MEKITIHAALVEKKKLDQRIRRSIDKLKIVGTIKGNDPNQKVYGTTLNKDNFKQEETSLLQSINDLMDRRNLITRAITLSNATTKTMVGKKEMYVTEAIEMKASISYKKLLLQRIKVGFLEAKASVERKNSLIESNLDNILENMPKELSKDFIESYKTSNGYTLVDPLDAEKIINKLEEEIEDFESNVDLALSVSNATTFIEIE